jgi:hypothetical protein
MVGFAAGNRGAVPALRTPALACKLAQQLTGSHDPGPSDRRGLPHPALTSVQTRVCPMTPAGAWPAFSSINPNTTLAQGGFRGPQGSR